MRSRLPKVGPGPNAPCFAFEVLDARRNCRGSDLESGQIATRGARRALASSGTVLLHNAHFQDLTPADHRMMRRAVGAPGARGGGVAETLSDVVITFSGDDPSVQIKPI